jgi:hypothetical protein
MLLRTTWMLMFATVMGCAAEATDNGRDLTPLQKSVSPEATLLIAFDGTGDHIETQTSIARMFADVVLSATAPGKPTAYTFKTAAKTHGAVGSADWAYKSYVRADAKGRVNAIYYNGAPEGATSLRFGDSGSHFIYDDAMGGNETSPVCRAVRDPATKNVFLIGYSRGAVLAHLAAYNILRGVCGFGTGDKLKWVGLLDPVEAGSPQGYVQTEPCDPEAASHHVYDNSVTLGCLSLLRSNTNGRVVPATVIMKSTANNAVANTFLLSTMPANGATYREFDFPSSGIQPHIAMAQSPSASAALRADAKNRGGLRFR